MSGLLTPVASHCQSRKVLGKSGRDALSFHAEPTLEGSIEEIWRWRNYDVSDGLPSDEAVQVTESASGRIWALTAKGLAWFDGYAWNRPHCTALTGGQLGERLEEPDYGRPQAIQHMQPFEGDRVLIVVRGRVMVVGPNGCETRELLAGGRTLFVSGASALHEGEVVVDDAAHNIYSWHPAAKAAGPETVTPIEVSRRLVARQAPKYSYGSSVWVASDAGLLQLKPGGARRLQLPSPIDGQLQLMRGVTVRAVAENRRGDGLLSFTYPPAWIGLWEWNAEGALRRAGPAAKQSARLLAISERGEGIAMYSAREVYVRGAKGWSRLSPVPALIRAATALYFDSQRRLWAATPKGLACLRLHLDRWSVLSFPFPDLRNHILSILPAADGTLWLGTAGGLVMVEPDGERRELTHILGQELGLVTGLAEGEDGSVWISSGATFTGAFRYRQGQWRRYGLAEGLPDAQIHRMRRDEKGRIWALATGGARDAAENLAGAFLLAKDAARFERWDRARGLGDPRVYAVSRTPDGALWFGTSSGISVLRPAQSSGAQNAQQNERWEHWDQNRGVRSRPVFDLWPRHGGGIYFTDRGNGLGVIEADGKLHFEKIGDHAVEDSAWQILEDDHRGLWVTTRGGLFHRQHSAFAKISGGAGLENGDLWPIAEYRGNVCVGTDGSGLFCLDKTAAISEAPQIQLLQKQVEESRVSISWRTRSHETALDSDGILTRSRLDAGPWSEWSKVLEWTRNGVSPGPHTLVVEASASLGGQNRGTAPVSLRVDFEVPRPLWERPQFAVPLAISMVLGLLAIAFGVWRRLTYTRELAQKEERFRALIEFSSIGITLRDRQHKVFYTSPAVEEILGYPTAELLGGMRTDLIHPEDLEGVQVRSRLIAETPGLAQRSRIRMRHKDGGYRWVEVTSRNLLHNPAVAAIVTNYRDVTEATQAELKAAEARQRAESANQAKSDFLAMISHEIRTPMNGITGMCHLLLDTHLNAEQKDYAETIAQSARALLALINDVLDFSRIEAGKLTIERAPLDLAALLAEVAALMRVRAEEKGLRLSVTYPPEAPKAFYGDSLRIRQILINLVGNAIKFTQSGSVDIRFAARLLGEGRVEAAISVVDTGIGIPPEKLRLVFEKFTQADASTTRRFGGSGLGLSISRSLAELMGGSIVAESEVGVGSTFTLLLTPELAAAEALRPSQDRSAVLRPLDQKLAVLIVEDNPVNQKLAARLLERLGCEVKLASSGNTALRMHSEYRFDLILMDCQMPGMDGYETTRLIRQKEAGRRRTPIVAITANAMENDLERCIEAGMDAYLTKPIDLEKLREALEEWGAGSPRKS